MDCDLPDYIPEPPLSYRRRAKVAAPAAPSGGRPPPYGGQTPRVSGVFSRMIRVAGDSLAVALDEWWTSEASAGVVTVQRRLRLERPFGAAAVGWTMKGRLQRATRLHWLPVVLELWPVHRSFTRMTMSPEVPVHIYVGGRYFRTGHAVLDRLAAQLVEAQPVAHDGRCTAASLESTRKVKLSSM